MIETSFVSILLSAVTGTGVIGKLLWFLGALTFSTIDDILVVFYLRRVRDDILKAAVFYSMALGAVQLLGTNFFIEARWLGIPILLGNGLGTAIAMRYEKNHPYKKPRDEKGRFRPQIPPASFQVGDKK
jgi:hypothetical protein